VKRAERRIDLALGAGAAVALASFVVVLRSGPTFTGAVGTALGVLLAAAIVAAPYSGVRLAIMAESRALPALLVAAGPVAVHVAVLIALIGCGAEAVVLGAMCLFAIHLFRRRASDAAAAGATVAAPVVVTAGFALAPGVAWLALYPAALATAVAGAVALQERQTARRASLARRSATAREPEAAEASPARVRQSVVALTIALIVASFAVHLGVNVVPEPLLRLSDRGGTVETAPAERERASRGASGDANEAFRQIFPSDLGHGRGVTQLQRETVMLVRPTDGVDHGPLYMRGMVLDVMTRAGATFRGGRGARREAGRDGWIQLADPPARGAATIELEVAQQPIKIREGELGILFAPERLFAIQRPAVEHDPDGLLITPAPEPDWFRFRCRVEERRAGRVELVDLRARHPDPSYLERPSGSAAALAELDAEARRAVSSATDDAARVLALVRWFHREFTYDLEASEFPGIDGVAAFVRDRRGPCTWFASAATLMLRGLDIPARIATGFIAKEYDDEQGAYVVTTREGHAWVEAHFEGLGWVTFDPTPPEQRDGELAAALAGDAPPGLTGWARGLAGRLGEWAQSGGDAERMREVLASLKAAPAALWASLVGRFGRAAAGGVVIGFAAIVLGLVSRLVRRRRRGSRAPREPGGAEARFDARAATLRARLVAALAKLGLPRRPPQTLRELAESAARAISPERGGGRALTAAAATLDRARFGDVALEAAEESRIEALVGALEKGAAAKSTRT